MPAAPQAVQRAAGGALPHAAHRPRQLRPLRGRADGTRPAGAGALAVGAPPLSAPRCPPVRRLPPPRGLGSEMDADDGAYITTEAQFDATLASADVVALDFMALWCRKCKYIKPKLMAMMQAKFPAIPLAFVNVNAVPAAVVSGAGVTKMPTVCVYVRGQQVSSYVAGDSAAAAVIRVEADVAAAVKAAKAAKAGR